MFGLRRTKWSYLTLVEQYDAKNQEMARNLDGRFEKIQGVFKKRPNFCYKYSIAHFTAF